MERRKKKKPQPGRKYNGLPYYIHITPTDCGEKSKLQNFDTFLQTRYPSCHPTNSVKALKEISTKNTVMHIHIFLSSEFGNAMCNTD